MRTPSMNAAQLALLEKKIDKTMRDLASTYPFLKSDIRSERQEGDKSSDELALGALRELRESLSA